MSAVASGGVVPHNCRLLDHELVFAGKEWRLEVHLSPPRSSRGETLHLGSRAREYRLGRWSVSLPPPGFASGRQATPRYRKKHSAATDLWVAIRVVDPSSNEGMAWDA